jgi:hypothetical protein
MMMGQTGVENFERKDSAVFVPDLEFVCKVFGRWEMSVFLTKSAWIA